jgi:hypothetical protein
LSVEAGPSNLTNEDVSATGELGNIEKYQVSVMKIHSGTSSCPFKPIGFRTNGGFLIMKTQFDHFFLPEAVG